MAYVFPKVASTATVVATCRLIALVMVYALKFTVRIYDKIKVANHDYNL